MEFHRGAVSPSRPDDQSRVVLVGPGPGTRGGIAQFNMHLAEALLDQGAAVQMLTFARLYPSWTRPGRQAAASTDAIPAGVRVKEVLVAWRPWTWFAGVRFVRETSPTVVVFQWWHPMFAFCYIALSLAAHASGAQVVFVCHNAEPHESFPFSRVLTRLALRRGDQLFALSESVSQALAVVAPRGRITCLGHPPYTALSHVDGSARDAWLDRIDAGSKKIVLFFGNVRPYKGLSDLIAAFPEIRSHVQAVLVVAGTFFESIDAHRARINELGIEEDVRLFSGYVPDGEVGALLSVADLIVLPYRSGSQTGIVPLAASVGTPVVVTAVGGIAEGLGTGARAAPPGDPGALAAAVVASLELPTANPPATARWEEWAHALIASGARAR